MNSCYTCKHLERHSYCNHPDNDVDHVTGDRLVLCRIARSSLYGKCGPSGWMWAEIPPPPPPPPPPRPWYRALWERIKWVF